MTDLISIHDAYEALKRGQDVNANEARALAHLYSAVKRNTDQVSADVHAYRVQYKRAIRTMLRTRHDGRDSISDAQLFIRAHKARRLGKARAIALQALA